LSDVSFSLPKTLLRQIRRYYARGGFFDATVEMIGAPSFEIGWSGPSSALDEHRVGSQMSEDSGQQFAATTPSFG